MAALFTIALFKKGHSFFPPHFARNMYPSDLDVTRWHTTLKYFRFSRGPGGHGGNLDTLSASLRFDGLAELISLFAALGCPLQAIAPGAPRVERGKSYDPEACCGLVDPLEYFPDFAKPGRCKVFGCPCIVAVNRRAVDIYLCGAGDPPDYWSVTRQDYRNALKLESRFDRLGLVAIRA